jgi:hypothetical protein
MEPMLLKEVLTKEAFTKLKVNVNSLLESNVLHLSRKKKRKTEVDNSIAMELHHGIIKKITEGILGYEVKPSYSYLSCYVQNGILPIHVDRPPCKYTLDFCIERSGTEWPLFVNETPYLLEENEALFYLGCECPHYRTRKPDNTVTNVLLFHYVDLDYDGPLQ